MFNKKTKVMIVDDEKNIRDGLKLIINWANLGCEVVDTAENGMEALEICRYEDIEIIVTDIKMPIMDGLELAKNISERYPWIFIIITSAYRDFEYAQTAIQYKVNSYLVKPIDEVKLSSEINKIVAKIRKQQENKYRERVRELFTMAVYAPLNHYNFEAVYDCIDKLGFDFDEVKVACVQIRFLHMMQNVSEIISCFFEIHHGIYDIDHSGNIIFLAATPNDFKDIMARLSEIKYQLDQKLNNTLFIAIGSHAKSAEDLYGSYISSNNVFFTNMVDSNAELADINELFDEKSSETKEDVWKLEEMMSAIENGQSEELNFCMKKLEHYLKTQQHSVALTLGIVSTILHRMNKIDKQCDCKYHLKQIQLFDNLQDILDYMQVLSVDILQKFTADNSDGSKRLVKQLKKLIDENVSDPALNVKFLAKQTNYNSSYIGRTFSMQENVSIKEYISQKRISEASRLLTSTNLSVFDISTQVGYNDLSTFYEIFKRVKATTPKEYRQVNLNESINDASL